MRAERGTSTKNKQLNFLQHIKTLLEVNGRAAVVLTNPLKPADLEEFVACYNVKNRHERKTLWGDKNPEGRWRGFEYDELLKRDKLNLDIFWLKDKSPEDSDNLPEPDVLAQEIIDDLESALEQLRSVAAELKG